MRVYLLCTIDGEKTSNEINFKFIPRIGEKLIYKDTDLVVTDVIHEVEIFDQVILIKAEEIN